MSTTTSLSEFTDALTPSSAQAVVVTPTAVATTGADSTTATQLEDTLLAAGSYSMANLYDQSACPSAPGVVCRASNASVSRAEELARTGQTRQKNIRGGRVIDRAPDASASQAAAAGGESAAATVEGCTSSTLKGFQMSLCPPQLGAGVVAAAGSDQSLQDRAYNAVTFYD